MYHLSFSKIFTLKCYNQIENYTCAYPTQVSRIIIFAIFVSEFLIIFYFEIYRKVTSTIQSFFLVADLMPPNTLVLNMSKDIFLHNHNVTMKIFRSHVLPIISIISHGSSDNPYQTIHTDSHLPHLAWIPTIQARSSLLHGCLFHPIRLWQPISDSSPPGPM